MIAIVDHVGIKAGMDHYTSGLASGLLENGCRVCVYSNYSRSDLGYEVVEIFDGHSSFHFVRKLVRHIRALIVACSRARKSDARLLIQHVFASDYVSLLNGCVAKVFGRRLLVIAHDVSSLADEDVDWIRKLLYQVIADKIVVHNEYSLSCLRSLGLSLKQDSVEVLRHGSYLDSRVQKVDKQKARASLGLAPSGRYLLFFGQIKQVKGLDILLQSMSLIDSDVNLIVAGKPWKDSFDSYEVLIKELDLDSRIERRVRFIEDSERDLLFSAADCIVLPYRQVFQSGVLLMVMGFGLPVIASDLPSISEIVTHSKNGLLFRSEDSSDLAKCISEFYEMNDWELIANAAQATIQDQFSWTSIAARYAAIARSS